MLQKLKVYSLAQNKRWHFAVILYNGQAVMSVCFCYVLHVRHLLGLKNEHEKQYFGDADRSGGDAAKAEQGRDDRNNKE